MFQQHGAPIERSNKDVLLQPTNQPSNPSISSSKWVAAMSHLMQHSGIKGKIDPNWILLVSQSTINMFCNAKLLVNIHCSKYSLDIHSTVGKSTTNWIDDLPGFGTV
eukprot:7607159-Ditylum_brightwellii.AAC.2